MPDISYEWRIVCDIAEDQADPTPPDQRSLVVAVTPTDERPSWLGTNRGRPHDDYHGHKLVSRLITPEIEPPEEQRKKYEIGWFTLGCSAEDGVVDRQRDALDEMLTKHSRERELWVSPPEIREDHNHEATVGILDFGRYYAVNRRGCSWAVYGVLVAEPEDGDYVPEGTRLPLREAATDG